MEIGYGSGWDAILPHMEPIPYDPIKDMQPVAGLSVQPSFLVAPGNSPFNSLEDVFAWQKKENKPITVSLGTTGSSPDFVVKAVSKISGVPMTSVPHTGGGAAITTLLGGNTTLTANQTPEFATFLKDGRLKPIVVASKVRDQFMPNVKTLIESGVNFSSWGVIKAVVVAPGTPKEIVTYYEDLFKKITNDEEFKKIMKDMYQPINYMGTEEFTKFFKEVYNDYGKLAKEFKVGSKNQ